MSKLTDQDLADWRARRTGKPVNLAGDNTPGVPTNAGGDPAAIRLVQPPFMQNEPPVDIDPAPAVDPAPAGNQTNEELEQLRQQLAAANGRLGPAQRQSEEMKAALEAQQRQIAELQAMLAEQQAAAATRKAQEAAANFDPFEGLSPDEVAMLDPTAADLIRKATRNAYSKAASQVKDPEEIIRKTLAERDAAALRKYIQATAASTGLTKLATDPRFEKFVAEDDSATLLLNSFMQAADIEIAQTLEPNLRRLIKRFEKTTDSTRNPDPQDQLASHLARAPGAAPTGAQQRAVSADDVKTITAKARALARAGKHKEANQLLASINN